MLIDTHCHFALDTADAQIAAAIANGVTQMITIGTEAKDWSVYQGLHVRYPQNVFYTVGLHPCEAHLPGALESLEQLEGYFEGSMPPVALGECGLDYNYLPKDIEAAAAIKAQQQTAFEYQLKLAKKLDCPLVVHSRLALEDVIAQLRAYAIDPRRVLVHCFSEDVSAMRRLKALGFRASFTGIITYKNAQAVRDAAFEQGLESLMLETDAPFLAPMPKRGQLNEPAYTRYIAEYCAQLFRVSVADIECITTRNAREFFGLPKDLS